MHFFCSGDQFYHQYINIKMITKYIDDDGKAVKPKQFSQKHQHGKIVYFVTVQEVKCGIEILKTEEIFGINRKSTEYIYLPWSQYRKAESYLKLRSCLQDTVNNYDPRIGKYINEL